MRVRKGKKLILAIAVCLSAIAGSFPAAAAEIKKLKIRLEAEVFDENGRPIADFMTDSEEYEVVGFEKMQEQLYEVELSAADGMGFGELEQSDIRLTGIPAICRRAVRKNGGETLILTIKADGLSDVTGEIGHAGFTGSVAVWDQAENASAYMVLLFRNSKRIGHTHRTQGNRYDFTPLMKEKGVYHYKVIPLSTNDKKGIPAESDWYQVDEGKAKSFFSQFGENHPVNPGWEMDESGWRYWLKDGTFPQENWLLLDENWYYFDSDGYMVTDDWRPWKGRWYYLNSTGLIEKESEEEKEPLADFDGMADERKMSKLIENKY